MYFCVSQRVGARGHAVTRDRPITVRNGTIMPNHRVRPQTGDKVEVAVYVASMSADLANMARHSGLETLGYLLEMVRLEAENAARHLPSPNGMP